MINITIFILIVQSAETQIKRERKNVAYQESSQQLMRYDDTFAYVKEIYQPFEIELQITENADKTENAIKFM